MSAHTPGPDSPLAGHEHASCGHCSYRFGQVWLCPLHAAAPALLEALERTLTLFDLAADESMLTSEQAVEIEQARAAIRAAKGETA